MHAHVIAIAALGSLVACGRLGFEARPDDARDDGTAQSPSRCQSSTRLVCDGFESGALDPMWTAEVTSGVAAIDPSRAFRGGASLHVRIDAIAAAVTDPHAMLLGAAGLTPIGVTGSVYVRAWAYIAAPFDSTFFGQLVNIADDAGTGSRWGFRTASS